MKKTPLARLVSLEKQFSEIERITKLLRKRLDEVAETVRVAADDLRLPRSDDGGQGVDSGLSGYRGVGLHRADNQSSPVESTSSTH